MGAMRLLAGVAALLFLYLALIPAGLIYSTLDSACSGPGCDATALARVLLTLLYGACLVVVVGTAALFGDYAVRGTPRTQRRLPPALAVTGVVIGIAVYVLFTIAFPAGGAVALAVAIVGLLLVRLRRGGREARAPEDPEGELAAIARGNGHSPNGHRPGGRVSLRGSRRR